MIAQRSRGAVAFQLALAVAGLLTPFMARKWGEGTPSLLVLAMVATPVAVVWFGRSVHAWFLPQRIELDEAGLRFAWADAVTLMPWMQRHDREVAWSELRGVRTSTLSVNGVSSTSLVVVTADGSFEIPDRGFDRSAHTMQCDILDFVARAQERPVAAATAYARHMAERHATPERLVASARGPVVCLCLFLPFIGFMDWLAYETPFWLTYGLAALTTGLFGWMIVLAFTTWHRDRLLVLRADGLALGPSDDRLRVIPWDRIRIVRREQTNGTTDGIEIVDEDGARTNLRGVYGRSLDALALAIDPERNA